MTFLSVAADLRLLGMENSVKRSPYSQQGPLTGLLGLL